ncbi:MAG: hypothetical protein H0X26_06820 [Alphaproteobacteria bacterium]|nr:hypothetical protein [Alphaproteobacteria bacterium]
MTDKEKYLKQLKNELNKYTKQLSDIQGEFRGNTGTEFEKINQSLQNILHEAVVAYGKLESASAKEWAPVKALTNEAFNNLKDSFNEKLYASADQIKAYAGKIEENYQEQLDCVATYVRKHPFKSLFLAAGTGFILGKILK